MADTTIQFFFQENLMAGILVCCFTELIIFQQLMSMMNEKKCAVIAEVKLIMRHIVTT